MLCNVNKFLQVNIFRRYCSNYKHCCPCSHSPTTSPAPCCQASSVPSSKTAHFGYKASSERYVISFRLAEFANFLFELLFEHKLSFDACICICDTLDHRMCSYKLPFSKLTVFWSNNQQWKFSSEAFDCSSYKFSACCVYFNLTGYTYNCVIFLFCVAWMLVLRIFSCDENV